MLPMFPNVFASDEDCCFLRDEMAFFSIPDFLLPRNPAVLTRATPDTADIVDIVIGALEPLMHGDTKMGNEVEKIAPQRFSHK